MFEGLVGELLPMDMVTIFNLFQVDIACANIYLVLVQDVNSNKEICEVWVVKRLEEVHIKMNNSLD